MRTLFFILALCFTSPALAQSMPWIVIGDSIVSYPQGGDPSDLPFSLIMEERDVAFPSIASPSAAMGSTGISGFNSTWTTDTLDHICGYLSYCAGVVIQAGVNDFQLNNSWTAQQTSIRRVLDWAQARNKRVLMLDLVYNRDAEQGAPTNGAGLTFAGIRNARFMECVARQPRCVFALRPANLNVLTSGFYQADGTHLTPAGRRAYATWVESAASAAGLF